MTTIDLVLVRHGESEWNKDNKFCGWVDVPLSERGIEEAFTAAELLKEAGYYVFDKIHTSLLKRSTATADIIIRELTKQNDSNSDQKSFKCVKHWRLNERHYGALTGLNKIEMVKHHGLEKVMEWRRSFDSPPPPMTEDHPYYSEIGTNFSKSGKSLRTL
jgi:2,3-bisphosphoglycerate-dependent phosphoglycerate mutase